MYGANQVPRDNGGVIDFGDGSRKRIGAERDYNDAGKLVNGGNSQYEAQSAAHAEKVAQLARQGANDAQARTKDLTNFGENVNDRATMKGSNARESSTLKERQYNSEEKALDRAKSSKEFADTLNQHDKQMAQNRADSEYQNRINQQNIKQSQDHETSNRASDNLNQQLLQQSSIAGNKDLANIGQQTAISGQKSQVEQATIAAKAQVTAALMGGRSNYGGYW